MANAIKAAVPPNSPIKPNHSASPHSAIDAMKPINPTAIIALRPRRSDRSAHRGAQITQSSADQLYARLIQTSSISSAVPIEGMTDCIAVLPAAVVSITAKSSVIRSRDMLFGRDGGGGATAPWGSASAMVSFARPVVARLQCPLLPAKPATSYRGCKR